MATGDTPRDPAAHASGKAPRLVSRRAYLAKRAIGRKVWLALLWEGLRPFVLPTIYLTRKDAHDAASKWYADNKPVQALRRPQAVPARMP